MNPEEILTVIGTIASRHGMVVPNLDSPQARRAAAALLTAVGLQRASLLDSIINHGNRSIRPRVRGENRVVCRDGFTMSVIAGAGTHCTPCPDWAAAAGEVPADYPGPYTHVEVGFPSARPEPWDQWAKYAKYSEKPPIDNVYTYVPVEMVRALVAAHGGEA